MCTCSGLTHSRWTLNALQRARYLREREKEKAMCGLQHATRGDVAGSTSHGKVICVFKTRKSYPAITPCAIFKRFSVGDCLFPK